MQKRFFSGEQNRRRDGIGVYKSSGGCFFPQGFCSFGYLALNPSTTPFENRMMSEVPHLMTRTGFSKMVVILYKSKIILVYNAFLKVFSVFIWPVYIWILSGCNRNPQFGRHEYRHKSCAGVGSVAKVPYCTTPGGRWLGRCTDMCCLPTPPWKWGSR